MRFVLISQAALVIACATGSAWAEIPSQRRETADVVVKGTVEGVYVRDEGYYYNYVVELRVDAVEKGDGLDAGSTLYVSCFKRKASAPQEPSARGHKPPPKKGEQIQAFVKTQKGKNRGIYPNWYDELKLARRE